MDKKTSSATASSSSGKHGEKKDENFLTKTAHSIRDKVHGLADDVKEKTHNLTHSSDSKKNKKDKDHKKKDTKLKTSSKPPTAAKKDSGSESDDEDDSPKPAPPSSASVVAKRVNERDIGKSNTSASKPPSAAAAEKGDAMPSTTSRIPAGKLASSDSTSKSSDDPKDAAAPSSSTSKPPADNSVTKPSGPSSSNDSKPSTDKSNNAADEDGTNNKSSPGETNKDQVHISFYGISTVDDLLDRIDEAIEKAKIVVENGQDTTGLDIERTIPAPTPSRANLEKIPVEKTEDDENDAENKEGEEEPIRINYNEIRRIEDLLLKVNKQPGKRKVILENAPDHSASITVQKQASRPPVPLSTSTTTNENDDPSAPPKSILKTSQDPSSLDTSTKTSSFQDDQIHVNIEGVQSIDDLLDRVDEAVEKAPVVIDTKSQGEKRQAPQAPNQNDNNNHLAASISAPIQKRDAPKAPTLINEHSNNGINKSSIASAHFSPTSATQPYDQQEEDDNVPNFQIPDHALQNKTSTSGKKTDQNEASDWI